MIPRRRDAPLIEKAPVRIDPPRLIEMEVEEIEIQMPENVKLFFVLKKGDSCKEGPKKTIITMAGTNEEVKIDSTRIYWISRRKRTIQVPEPLPLFIPKSIPAPPLVIE